MKVVEITLHRDKLLALPELERTFFIGLGHFANEINAVTKLLYWAAVPEKPNSVEDRGNFVMMLVLIRYLAGALNESWLLIDKKFHGTGLSKTYHPMLGEESSNEIKSLKRYFNRTNAAKQIRNKFAYHYSAEEVATALPHVEKELHAYLDNSTAPNNLFHFSEVLLGKAIVDHIESTVQKTSLIELVDELLEVSALFQHVADALMTAIITSHGEELRVKHPEEVLFEDLMKFKSVKLPWFTDTSDAATSG